MSTILCELAKGVIRYLFSIGRAYGAPSLDPWERKTVFCQKSIKS
ncbi:hypothetical protein [Enterobacter phage vB_ExiM_F5M1E]|nr:hypothetical protein [Enterobacter phage vB_ExiM_F1M1E]UNA03112.1 hypothetical protein [Enterobacter phage vB_ExiM_F2M1E]UNA03433.1 hypothetical protein [Enterobacter phage vB_ExiM_F4M1E]UNA03754.1 hypothetical protein [Enterobacter phage vB_ExiM_F5M1E]UNA04074.1 hypothetical protein [Pantoea phage vB_PdiM_F5M2A]